MPHETPQESIQTIRRKLIAVEEAVKELHKALDKGFETWGHMLVEPSEIAPLAGGGTPKLPPTGGGG